MNVPVRDLLLDPDNPRLPADLIGGSPADLFAYLYDNAVLDELVESMLDNGFFEHEPLITLPPEADGRRIVIEGNRRLAALQLIHRLGPAADYAVVVEPTRDQLALLEAVPVFEVQSREDVRRFLGYRHISGLKPWPAEAKARYVYNEVERATAAGHDDPFREVGRQVGSNAQGVRTSYLALALLRFAQLECGHAVGHVLNRRFGVWIRCMSSADLRVFMGVGDARSYADVSAAVSKANCSAIGELIGDLTPAGEGKRPILQDSRDVTDYGRVVLNERAHAVLRRHNDFTAARQLIRETELATRIESIRRQVEALHDEIRSASGEELDGVLQAVEALERAARALRGTITALVE